MDCAWNVLQEGIFSDEMFFHGADVNDVFDGICANAGLAPMCAEIHLKRQYWSYDW